MATSAASCAREPEVGGTGATAAAVGGTAAFAEQRVADPAFGRPDTARRAAVLEYARGVRFATDTRLTDEQAMLDRGRRGPVVRVEASEHGYRLTRQQLQRGALIARFISAGEYAPMGLRRGEYYLFVDSAASWRSVIVPADSTQPIRVMQLAILAGPHVHVAGARWFESAGLTYSNPPCGRECCVPCDPTVGYSCPTRPFAPLDIGMPTGGELPRRGGAPPAR